MELFTKEIKEKLLSNGESGGADFIPVVKLFTPHANCIWLLTDLLPDEHDVAFGLCDLGMGFPELGYIYLPEILGVPELPVERDKNFKGIFPISIYAEAASMKNYITTDETFLNLVKKAKEQ